MKHFIAVALAVLFVFTVSAFAADPSENVPRMTKEQLLPLLNDPNVVVLDARQMGDWDNSQTKIKGAVRVDPKAKVGSLLDAYPKDKTVVIYCS